LATFTVTLDPYTAPGRAELVALVAALADMAHEQGAVFVGLDSSDLVVRHAARMAGLSGGLRWPLEGRVGEVTAWQSRHETAVEANPATADDRVNELVTRLSHFGVAAVARRPLCQARRLVRAASRGLGATLDVDIPWGPRRTLVFSFPDRSDLMPEALAIAAGTATRLERLTHLRPCPKAPEGRSINGTSLGAGALLWQNDPDAQSDVALFGYAATWGLKYNTPIDDSQGASLVEGRSKRASW
jgi:hypothetical protein